MTAYYSCVYLFFKSLKAVTLSSKFTYKTRSLLTILAVFTTTSSFAASAILPPLPTQQPQPATTTEQVPITSPSDISKPTPLEPAALVTIPKESQEVNSPSKEQTDSISIPAAKNLEPVAAVEVTPALESKKQEDSTNTNHEQEHESFIDLGQKKLPRIGGEGGGQNPNSYNASDLRIPVIESEEKSLKQNHLDSQISNNKPAANPEAVNPAVNEKPKELDKASEALPADVPTATIPALLKPDTQAAEPAAQNLITPTESHVTIPEANSTPSVSSAPLPDNIAPPQSKAENSPAQPSDAVQNTNVAPVIVPPQVVEPKPSEVKADASVVPEVTSAPAAKIIASPTKQEASSSLFKQENDKYNEGKNNHSKPQTDDHIKFIDDESIVFTLADDDIELGKITEAARIGQMSGSDYIKLFWKSYENPRNEMRRRDVDLFLAMYEVHLAEEYDGAMDREEASNQAFDVASKGKLSDLRAIITYYPVLQMRDTYGNTMLGAAIESNNIDVAKFLLIRGIDLKATNYDGRDAFSIAREENNDEAFDLLSKAKFSRKK